MTTDARKRGLRAAVEAKVHSFSPDFRMLYPNQIDLLWSIIDSLVEECAEPISLSGEEVRLRDCIDRIAWACVEKDLDEAYHWAYTAIVRDLTLPANEQSALTGAAIERGRAAVTTGTPLSKVRPADARHKIGEIRHGFTRRHILDVIQEPTGEVSIDANPVDTYANLEDLEESLYPSYQYFAVRPADTANAHDPDCPACNKSWPWCEACQSYHSPCNPTCFAKVRPAGTAMEDKV